MVSPVLDDRGAFSYQAVFQAIDILYSRVFQKHAMFHNRRDDPTSVTDRGKRPYERAFDLHIVPDNHGSSDCAPNHVAPFPQIYPTRYLALTIDLSDKLSLHPFIQHNAVGGQKVVLFSGIEPPAVQLMT